MKGTEIMCTNKNFDNIVNEDLKQHLKDELMTEMNQSISSAVPRAVRDLPYLVTCGYQVYVAQLVQIHPTALYILFCWDCALSCIHCTAPNQYPRTHDS